MAEIISLESLKNQKAAQRGFRKWQHRFKSDPILNENTKWSDLPDDLILFLAEDNEGSRLMIHDLLMGGLGLGNGYELESLPPEKLLPLLDIYFLILDLVRFECMRRLGWVQEVLLAQKPIIVLIREYRQGLSPILTAPPLLNPNHPAFPEYQLLNDIERQSFIRRIIPEAVKEFQARNKNDGKG